MSVTRRYATSVNVHHSEQEVNTKTLLKNINNDRKNKIPASRKGKKGKKGKSRKSKKLVKINLDISRLENYIKGGSSG